MDFANVQDNYRNFLKLVINTKQLFLLRISKFLAKNSDLSIKAIKFEHKHPVCKTMSLIPSFFGNRSSSVFDPFALDVWDPFKDFPFPSSSSALASQFPQETSTFVNTRVDWKETPEAHVFEADLPGLKKEEVKVEVEDDRVLQISGQRKVEKEDKKDTWHRVERSSGMFSRRFRLPENVKMDHIKASMENGVLTVTVPKVDVKKHDAKAIEISG